MQIFEFDWSFPIEITVVLVKSDIQIYTPTWSGTDNIMKKLVALLPVVFALLFASQSIAQDGPVWIEYEDGLVNDLLAEDKVVVISYYTEWCKACETQVGLIDRLRSGDAAYEQLVYVRVDWDIFEKRSIVRNFDVFGRSTILVVQTGGELANIFADTSRAILQEALDLGVEAVLAGS